MDKLSSWLFWINVGNSFAVRFTFNEAFYTESQIWRQIGDKIDTGFCGLGDTSSLRKLFFDCLVPSRSLLIRCPREVWKRAGERTPSRPPNQYIYWQNTPDFSTILPLVTIFKFNVCVLQKLLSVGMEVSRNANLSANYCIYLGLQFLI